MLKELRKATGLSQTEFGNRLGGIPLRTIQNWEEGKASPPAWVIELIKFRLQHDDNIRK